MPKKNARYCSFCGCSEEEVPMLLTGANGYICSDCVMNAYHVLEEYMPGELANSKKDKNKLDSIDLKSVPKPKEIKDFLDQFIIGQDDAKRFMSVAVYNHYKRLSQAKSSDNNEVEIEKSNIIMVGSTSRFPLHRRLSCPPSVSVACSDCRPTQTDVARQPPDQ